MSAVLPLMMYAYTCPYLAMCDECYRPCEECCCKNGEGDCFTKDEDGEETEDVEDLKETEDAMDKLATLDEVAILDDVEFAVTEEEKKKARKVMKDVKSALLTILLKNDVSRISAMNLYQYGLDKKAIETGLVASKDVGDAAEEIFRLQSTDEGFKKTTKSRIASRASKLTGDAKTFAIRYGHELMTTGYSYDEVKSGLVKRVVNDFFKRQEDLGKEFVGLIEAEAERARKAFVAYVMDSHEGGEEDVVEAMRPFAVPFDAVPAEYAAHLERWESEFVKTAEEWMTPHGFTSLFDVNPDAIRAAFRAEITSSTISDYVQDALDFSKKDEVNVIVMDEASGSPAGANLEMSAALQAAVNATYTHIRETMITDAALVKIDTELRAERYYETLREEGVDATGLLERLAGRNEVTELARTTFDSEIVDAMDVKKAARDLALENEVTDDAMIKKIEGVIRRNLKKVPMGVKAIAQALVDLSEYSIETRVNAANRFAHNTDDADDDALPISSRTRSTLIELFKLAARRNESDDAGLTKQWSRDSYVTVVQGPHFSSPEGVELHFSNFNYEMVPKSSFSDEMVPGEMKWRFIDGIGIACASVSIAIVEAGDEVIEDDDDDVSDAGLEDAEPGVSARLLGLVPLGENRENEDESDGESEVDLDESEETSDGETDADSSQNALVKVRSLVVKNNVYCINVKRNDASPDAVVKLHVFFSNYITTGVRKMIAMRTLSKTPVTVKNAAGEPVVVSTSQVPNWPPVPDQDKSDIVNSLKSLEVLDGTYPADPDAFDEEYRDTVLRTFFDSFAFRSANGEASLPKQGVLDIWNHMRKNYIGTLATIRTAVDPLQHLVYVSHNPHTVITGGNAESTYGIYLNGHHQFPDWDMVDPFEIVVVAELVDGAEAVVKRLEVPIAKSGFAMRGLSTEIFDEGGDEEETVREMRDLLMFERAFDESHLPPYPTNVGQFTASLKLAKPLYHLENDEDDEDEEFIIKSGALDLSNASSVPLSSVVEKVHTPQVKRKKLGETGGATSTPLVSTVTRIEKLFNEAMASDELKTLQQLRDGLESLRDGANFIERNAIANCVRELNEEEARRRSRALLMLPPPVPSQTRSQSPPTFSFVGDVLFTGFS